MYVVSMRPISGENGENGRRDGASDEREQKREDRFLRLCACVSPSGMQMRARTSPRLLCAKRRVIREDMMRANKGWARESR